MKRLVVLGSLNVDLVVAGVRLPAPGETVTGGRFEQHHGGKGGNAAVAAARALRGGPLEGRVAVVGAVGDDDHGRAALQALRDEGIDVAAVRVLDDAATGVALIVVAPDGENQIAVASGANARLDAPSDRRPPSARFWPTAGCCSAASRCRRTSSRPAPGPPGMSGATVVLVPAPAGAFTAGLADLADVLTPNEVELATLGGVDRTPGRPTGAAAGRHPGRGRRTTHRSGRRRHPPAGLPPWRRGRHDRRGRHLQRRARRGPAGGAAVAGRRAAGHDRGRPVGRRWPAPARACRCAPRSTPQVRGCSTSPRRSRARRTTTGRSPASCRRGR